MKEQTAAGKLLKGTIVIVAVSVLAKIISFITEAILAGYLGTTYQSDAYYMVASIQNVIYPMLSFGIWTVYLPIYKEKITIGEQKSADELADKVITVTTIASAAVVAVLMAFSPAVVSVVAPGFEGETKRLCAELVRLSAPMYIFIIAAAVYASMLQCHNRFLGSQIREVASHIPTILAAVFLYPKYGISHFFRRLHTENLPFPIWILMIFWLDILNHRFVAWICALQLLFPQYRDPQNTSDTIPDNNRGSSPSLLYAARYFFLYGDIPSQYLCHQTR